MERSIQSTSSCFMKALIENKYAEQPITGIFQEWFTFMQEQFQIEPNLIIYLKTSPEKLIDRIKQRGRKEEQNIKFEYLRQLNKIYEDWIETMRQKYKVVTINADSKLNEQVLTNLLNLIKKNYCKNCF